MNITISQNTTNRAVSQYKGFFFDRGMVTVNGETYGLNCGSLNKFGASNDNGTAIAAELNAGLIAFADGEKKARSFHVKGVFENDRAIEVTYAMDALSPATTYSKTTQSRVGAGGGGSLKFQGARAKHGEHLSVTVSNVSGAKFFISRIVAFLIRGCRR